MAASDRGLRATGDDTVRTKAIDTLRGVPWPDEFSFRVVRNHLTEQWAHREAEAAAAAAREPHPNGPEPEGHELGEWDAGADDAPIPPGTIGAVRLSARQPSPLARQLVARIRGLSAGS
jgi:NAD(P)H-dependent flavin oxidoreductase YrpB (nitropropane dioxygenase family)